MISRSIAKDFLLEQFEECKLQVPESINFDELVETWCLFVENDFYEWMKDSWRAFFAVLEGKVDWEWIRTKIEEARANGGLEDLKEKLPKDRRAALEDMYSEKLMEEVEWHNEQVVFSICKHGIISAEALTDKELVEQIKEMFGIEDLNWDEIMSKYGERRTVDGDEQSH